MWPDVSSRHGIPDVRLEDIEPLGFNLVTMHTLEKGAMYGMIDFSKHVIRERNTVYVDQHDMGMTTEERKQCMDMAVDWWLEREKEFKKLK
jgi:hypothetical protein